MKGDEGRQVNGGGDGGERGGERLRKRCSIKASREQAVDGGEWRPGGL